MDTEYFKVYNTVQAVWAQIAFIFNLETCTISAWRGKKDRDFKMKISACPNRPGFSRRVASWQKCLQHDMIRRGVVGKIISRNWIRKKSGYRETRAQEDTVRLERFILTERVNLNPKQGQRSALNWNSNDLILGTQFLCASFSFKVLYFLLLYTFFRNP